MAEHSSIEWTNATWNPITGCSVVSPGCTNCYAMKLAGTRLKHHWSRIGLTRDTNAGPVWTGEVRFNREWLTQPLRWKKPCMIFVCAHGDLFHPDVPDAWIVEVFAVAIAGWLLNGHTSQVLSKRAARMQELLSSKPFWDQVNAKVADLVRHHYDPLTIDDFGPDHPCPGIWLGTSVEDQRRAEERRAPLAELARGGWTTFASYEPALGPVDWAGWEFLAQLISGGESGDGARPTHPDWHRAARDFCAGAGVAFFFKQWGHHLPMNQYAADGTYRIAQDVGVPKDVRQASAIDNAQVWEAIGKKAAGRLLDGVEHSGMPQVARADNGNFKLFSGNSTSRRNLTKPALHKQLCVGGQFSSDESAAKADEGALK